MIPIVLIHGYSAESKSLQPGKIEEIYGGVPAALAEKYGGDRLVEIDLSRYISLDDGIDLDDVARALNRELVERHPQLLAEDGEGFHAIVHSTGALVIRNWLRLFSARPSRLHNLVYLAGANFGSGWAHIGKAQFAKWGRKIFGNTERGVRILHALELGSSATLDLHRFFLEPENALHEAYGVLEHVVIGTQADVDWYEAPIRYAKEDGSDGVVRVSGSNLNFNYVRYVPTEEAYAITWDEASRELDRHFKRSRGRQALYRVAEVSRAGAGGRPVVPFAIPYACAHSGTEMGIVKKKEPHEQVMRLLDQALSSTPASWPGRVDSFAAETEATYDEARTAQVPSWWKKWITEPRAQYDRHAQVIFRLQDQNGRPVEHFDIFFDSVHGRRDTSLPMRDLIEHKHVNSEHNNVIVFYLRTGAWADEEDDWDDLVAKARGCHLEVTATEPDTDEVLYLPLRIELEHEQLVEFVQPHRTTIVDVEMLRLPSDRVFKMVRLGG